MKIGIWSNSVVQLKLIYDKIINTGEHIKSSTFSYNDKNIMFQNGVVIRFLKPNENARGYRFDISLYDDNVQARSIEMYIAPIIPVCLPLIRQKQIIN